MKKVIIIFSLFAVCATASAFVYTQVLSEDDLAFEQIDNENGTAMSSVPDSENPWESYNLWQCFDMATVEFTCAVYDQDTLVPSLRVETTSEVFLFDTHVEDRLSCEQTLQIWQNLASGGKEICIFAASMHDVELELDNNKPQSLWYINRIKGANGYWDLHELNSAHDENIQ